MKVFYSDKNALHDPRWYLADGRITTCPEIPERAAVIRRAVRAAGMETLCVDDLEIDPRPAISAVHAMDYLAYLEHVHAAWIEEFGSDPSGESTFVVPDTFVPRPRLRGPGEDAGNGCSAPLTFARPEKISAQAGYYCFDLAAPIGAGTYTAAVASAKCAVAAAEQIARQHAAAAYALCRPPGHHAGRDYCGGFCYLNNAAIAAQQLVAAHPQPSARVAVIDIDYHHGNGTQDIFYDRDDVLFVSVHADPETQYPYFWGRASEIGAGRGAGCNLNIPLPRGAGEEAWLRAVERAAERVRQFDPASVVVSLGLDVSAEDPVGDFRVLPNGLKTAGQVLAGLARPTLFVQEGGYALNDLGPAALAVLQGFESNAAPRSA